MHLICAHVYFVRRLADLSNRATYNGMPVHNMNMYRMIYVAYIRTIYMLTP